MRARDGDRGRHGARRQRKPVLPAPPAASHRTARAATTLLTMRRTTTTSPGAAPIGGAPRDAIPARAATPGRPRASHGGRTFLGPGVRREEAKAPLDEQAVPLRRAIQAVSGAPRAVLPRSVGRPAVQPLRARRGRASLMCTAAPAVLPGPAPHGATFARRTATYPVAVCSGVRAHSTSPAHAPERPPAGTRTPPRWTRGVQPARRHGANATASCGHGPDRQALVRHSIMSRQRRHRTHPDSLGVAPPRELRLRRRPRSRGRRRPSRAPQLTSPARSPVSGRRSEVVLGGGPWPRVEPPARPLAAARGSLRLRRSRGVSRKPRWPGCRWQPPSATARPP